MASPITPPRRPAKRQVQPPPRDEPPTAVLKPKTDPNVERAIQLSTFESNYSTEDFLGTLSENIVAESKANPGPYNPRPFMQTFSPALDSLLSLRQQVADRTKKMESDVRRAEREYGKRLRELDVGFEAIGGNFSNLESEITVVSRTAVRIGEQLESLHQSRSSAQSTSLLLSYYLSLVQHTSTVSDPNDPNAPTHPLETLFATRTSREGRTRLSIILRRLMAVAKDMADNAATALSEAETLVTSANNEGGMTIKKLGKLRSEKERAERVRDEVERYCERFEKEVLRLFDRSYRKGDPRMMAHCARTLQDFNGGASCVQIYVNQHDFFMSKDRVLEDAERRNGTSNDLWDTIGDPDAPSPTSEPGLQALFKEVRVTVSQEAQIVKAVFPDPPSVMKVFIQRVFAQVIQQQLESLVSRATSISTLAVLRILNVTHSLCSSLVEDLKSYDALLADPASRSASQGTGTLAAMLDQALEEMYVPWLEGSRYLDSESKNLVELYAGLLSRFTGYHETVLKAKPNSLLDKVVNQLSSSGTSKDAGSSSTASAAAAAISRYASAFKDSASAYGNTASKATASPLVAQNKATGSSTPAAHPKSALPPHLTINTASGSSSPVPRSGAMSPVGGRPTMSRQNSIRGDLVNQGLEDKVWPTDGVVTIEMAERMLKWHAEAVGRVVELSPSADTAKKAFALFKVLAEAICRSFIETALDSAVASLENHDSKIEPDLSVMAVLKPADLICHLWQRYTSTAVAPLVNSSTVIRRELSSTNSHHIIRLEGKMNSVIQKALDSILSWLSLQLSKQKKNDYKPKNDELSFARNNTEPCQLCCDFLETVRDAAFEGLTGKNRESFLSEVGMTFHSLLLDHYKKFPVNPTGGLMLTKDLASYQEIATSFAIPAVIDRFEMLRQLGNSFIVQPNVLRSYLAEGHLGRIDTRLLRPYLAQRSDYSQFSRTLVLDDGLPADAGTSASSSHHPSHAGSGLGSGGAATGNITGMGGMFKGSRFSTMSGVAGVGMGKLKEMLKELETLSPDESDALRKEHAEAAERFKTANPGLRDQQFHYPSPVYFGMH